jgi:hypothetical protein
MAQNAPICARKRDDELDGIGKKSPSAKILENVCDTRTATIPHFDEARGER